jgi:hypothetical protein
MEAGIEETEENNAFGIIILLCSQFPLQLNVNSLSFRFCFVCSLDSTATPSHSILSSERRVFNARNLPFVPPDLRFLLRFKLRIKIRR